MADTDEQGLNYAELIGKILGLTVEQTPVDEEINAAIRAACGIGEDEVVLVFRKTGIDAVIEIRQDGVLTQPQVEALRVLSMLIDERGRAARVQAARLFKERLSEAGMDTMAFKAPKGLMN